ncbi:coproporphyrinogen III oxidase, partial [Campylobacterota bacterium]
FERGIVLDDDDRIRQFVIMELMSNFKLDIKRFESLYDLSFKAYFADEIQALKEFEEAGLVSVNDEKIEVSPTGTMLIRNIVMPFDAYMKAHSNSTKTFSKTV